MQRIADEVDDDLLKRPAKDSLSRQGGQAPMQLWWKIESPRLLRRPFRLSHAAMA